MKKIAAVYTGAALVDPMRKILKERLPGYGIINILDDSLIADVIAANGMTPQVAQRLLSYYQAAVDAGAVAILNTCSSVGEVVEKARPFVAVPIVRIDDAMTRKAVTEGKRIGVIATLGTTLGPTVRLVYRWASELGREVTVVEARVDEAFAAITEGDAAKHDALILEKAVEIAPKVDILLLAQGSMARMEEILSNKTGKPVFSSPRLGADLLKQVVEGGL